MCVMFSCYSRQSISVNQLVLIFVSNILYHIFHRCESRKHEWTAGSEGGKLKRTVPIFHPDSWKQERTLHATGWWCLYPKTNCLFLWETNLLHKFWSENFPTIPSVGKWEPDALMIRTTAKLVLEMKFAEQLGKMCVRFVEIHAWHRQPTLHLPLARLDPRVTCLDIFWWVGYLSDSTKNPVRRKFSRHIDIRRYFVRELVKGGCVKLIPLRTHKMVADALTKSLPSPAFIGQGRVMMGQTPFALKFWHSRCVYFSLLIFFFQFPPVIYFYKLPNVFCKCPRCAWGRAIHHSSTT